MTINGVTVNVPSGWRHDRLLVTGYHASQNYTLRLEFDNGIKLTTFAVYRGGHRYSYIDVSDAIEGANSCTIQVYRNGTWASGTWVVSIKEGRSWAQRSHESIGKVFADPNGEVELYMSGFDSYFNESTNLWNSNTGIVTLTSEVWSQDSIIHLGCGVGMDWRFRVSGNPLWYGGANDIGGGVYEWTVVNPEDDPDSIYPQGMYTTVDHPTAGNDVAYLYSDLSGIAKLVFETKDWTAWSEAQSGWIYDAPYRRTRDVVVVPTPCYKRSCYLYYNDADGAMRCVPVSVLDMSCDSGNEVYSGNEDWSQYYSGNGAISDVFRSMAKKSEFVTVGIESADSDMHLSDIFMNESVRLESDNVSVKAAVVDSEFAEPTEPTDITLRLQIA